MSVRVGPKHNVWMLKSHKSGFTHVSLRLSIAERSLVIGAIIDIIESLKFLTPVRPPLSGPFLKKFRHVFLCDCLEL